MSSTYVELDLARDEIGRVARTDALVAAADAALCAAKDGGRDRVVLATGP